MVPSLWCPPPQASICLVLNPVLSSGMQGPAGKELWAELGCRPGLGFVRKWAAMGDTCSWDSIQALADGRVTSGSWTEQDRSDQGGKWQEEVVGCGQKLPAVLC